MTYMKTDTYYMKKAIAHARRAAADKETPIGCVIVRDGRIIGWGRNRRNTLGSPLEHAEIAAIRMACRRIGDWRMEDCTLYVTLEPCQMCAGAMVQARLGRAVIGCMNPKAGSAGSVVNLLEMEQFNHQVDVTRGVMENECAALLKDFFRRLRQEKKENKKELSHGASGRQEDSSLISK